MTELWAVIGLAMLDGKFNRELKEARDDLNKLGEELQEYCFRLSSYELVELQRIISTKLTDFPDKCPEDVLEMMCYIFSQIWILDDPCWWAWWKAALDPNKRPNPKYQHPYLVFDEEMQKNVPGAVDPKTGEPISVEMVDIKVPAEVQGNGHASIKRFVKAKNH